ncbi:hypothetical protein F442_12932, partial [Phytophthora nicotianae P10297]
LEHTSGLGMVLRLVMVILLTDKRAECIASLIDWKPLYRRSDRWVFPDICGSCEQAALERALFEPAVVDGSDIRGSREQGAMERALFEATRMDAPIATSTSERDQQGDPERETATVDTPATSHSSVSSNVVRHWSCA